MPQGDQLTPEQFFEQERARLEKEAAEKAIEAAQAAAKLEEFKRKAEELHRLAAELHVDVVVRGERAPIIQPEARPAAAPQPQSQARPAADSVSAPASQPLPNMEGALSVRELINIYQLDPRSPYASLKFATRKYYNTCLKKLVETCGPVQVSDLKRADVQGFYDGWTNNGTERLPMGHSLVTMLRGVVNFGVKTLEHPSCERASAVLHHMHFPVVKARSEVLTPDHARAIIECAIKVGKPSIALAQAIQIDCRMQQKDVIGEWVPVSEPGVSPTIWGNSKWMRGLRWEELVGDSIVRRPAAGEEADVIQISLQDAPHVTAELSRLGDLPKSGPMIVCETTGRPWIANEYRRWWRKIARQAGVPDSVKNMDSRFQAEGRTPVRDVRMRGYRYRK